MKDDVEEVIVHGSREDIEETSFIWMKFHLHLHSSMSSRDPRTMTSSISSFIYTSSISSFIYIFALLCFPSSISSPFYVFPGSADDLYLPSSISSPFYAFPQSAEKADVYIL
ncbi:hypothetical protein Zmor_026221 [Zophobas morio]|uniref:Transmembrane protein n=1 Tax=Zophobas morio TaxID=2755281 RepID=A0AA38HYV2_9CUCU|nr:hypothetical protein Zmor_026221 [Zophobas morio]